MAAGTDSEPNELTDHESGGDRTDKRCADAAARKAHGAASVPTLGQQVTVRGLRDLERSMPRKSCRPFPKPASMWQPVLAVNPWAERPLPDALQTTRRFEADDGRWVFREGERFANIVGLSDPWPSAENGWWGETDRERSIPVYARHLMAALVGTPQEPGGKRSRSGRPQTAPLARAVHRPARWAARSIHAPMFLWPSCVM